MLTNTRTITVEWGDCDPNGIVFNPRYFAWFDASVHALLGKAGLSLRQLMADGADGLPLGETSAKFQLPSRFGDELQIETTVTKVNRCAFELQHRVTKNGAVAVEGFETRILTVFDKEAGRIKAAPLPPAMAAALNGE